MCGIFGSTEANLLHDAGWLDRCSELLRHRGPDAKGSFLSPCGNVVLGHTRLSIIDLNARSNQPIVDFSDNLAIVLNGEIYNHKKLRMDLQSHGLHFKTSSDTEVLLNAYRFWGEDCLSHLNGMFSFAIYDGRSKKTGPLVFFARDRAGEKPLFFRHSENGLSFSSELKALGPSGDLNLDALNYYLALGYVPDKLCLFDGFNKLPPANCAKYFVETNELTISPYWKLPAQSTKETLTDGSLFEELQWLIEDSVKLRLEADVPVGVLLSGGLDSSLITAAAKRCSDREINTFNIALPGSSLDESFHAQAVARHLGTKHHVLKLEEPTLDIIEHFSKFIDEPIADSSIIPSWMLFELVQRNVKVALGGDGGDELFGGYTDYTQSISDQNLFGKVPNFILRVIANFASHLPAGTRGRNRLYSVKNGALQQMIWGRPYFDLILRQRILSSKTREILKFKFDAPEQFLLSKFEEGNSPLDSMTRTHFGSILPDDFLVKVDRASMGNSLEVRAPMLDHRLIEFCFSCLPDRLKVDKGRSRIIQKRLVNKWLPFDFQQNRKQGFSIPINEWIRSDGEVKTMQRLEALPDIFCLDEVRALVRGHMTGRTNGGRIFALIMLSVAVENAANA